MPLVSLILTTTPNPALGSSAVESWKAGLWEAGHEVETWVVGADAVVSEPESAAEFEANPGRLAGVVRALRQARGEILLVLDPDGGYASADLARIVEPLVEGRAELAIATFGILGEVGEPQFRRGPVPLLLRKLVGVSSPTSGLVGLTRDALGLALDSFRPVGEAFALEFLARVPGRKVEVPVIRVGTRRGRRRPSLDDVRHWKRLADDRFGNGSRLVQFCAVGGSGVIVDLALFFALQPIFAATGLAALVVAPSKVRASLFAARVGAIAVALCWNFLLNRRLTFNYARSGSIGRQFATYALGNAPGIALNLLTFFGLTRKVAFFDQHRLAAALIGIVVATAISFPMSRWVAFKDRSARVERPRARFRGRPVRKEAVELAGGVVGDASRP